MSQGSDHVSSAHAPVSDEPKSPMWLPALGAALFLTAGLWWAVTPSAPDVVADAPAASATTIASAAPAPPPPPPPAPPSSAALPPQMRIGPGGAGAPSPSGVRMGARGPGGAPGADPAAVQRLIDQMKQKQH
jgi:hypothetical protein